MLKQVPLNPPPLHLSRQASRHERASIRSPKGAFRQPANNAHLRRPDFANARFLGDGTDLIDEGIRVCEFFPAGLEHRALRGRLELVRPRLAHRFGSGHGVVEGVVGGLRVPGRGAGGGGVFVLFRY